MSWQEIPEGFTDLASAYNAPVASFVNIIGIVVDLMPPTNVGSRDYKFSLKLSDRQFAAQNPFMEGLQVRFFKQNPGDFPKIKQVGDVVLLRNAKVLEWKGQPQVTSNYQTTCVVFPTPTIPARAFAVVHQASNSESLPCHGRQTDTILVNKQQQMYVIALKEDMSGKIPAARDTTLPPPRATTAQPGTKLQTASAADIKYKRIEQLQGDKVYCDVICEVVKCVPAAYGCDLYVTDYTSNEALRYYAPPEEQDTTQNRDGDAYGYSDGPKKAWPGPFGYLVLKLNLKPPHAHWAIANVKEGDFIVARNAKPRIADTAIGSWLEGDLWPDYKSPDKVLISKIPRGSPLPAIEQLRQRKVKYLSSRKATLEMHIPASKGVEMTKKQRKKRRRQEKELAKQAAEPSKEADEPLKKKANVPLWKQADRSPEDDGHKVTRSVKNHHMPRDETKPAKAAAKVASPQDPSPSNPHVRCAMDEIPLSPLEDVIDADGRLRMYRPPGGEPFILPFQNVNRRVKVRVVNFAPQDMRYWPIQGESLEYMDPLDEDVESTPPWEWCFCLLLEDASGPPAAGQQRARLWVTVNHADAKFFLGRAVDDPEDLLETGDPKILAQLRETMFVVWGNLQEKIEAEWDEKNEEVPLSNLPFECVIKEYGIEMEKSDPAINAENRGWRRMHGIWKTTVV